MKSKYWNNYELDVLQAEALAQLATPSSDGFMSATDKTIFDAATASYTPDTLIKRDTSGRAQVVDPSVAQDIATKNYVDDVTSAIQTQLNEKAFIETGNYSGTGTYGSDNRNSLIFSFVPKFIYISTPTESNTVYHMLLVYGSTKAAQMTDGSSSGASVNTVTWSSNTVFWYSTTNSDPQLNRGGYTYYYIAIG